jgi:hypothetical protein
MELGLHRLSETYKKSEPACDVCHYGAEYLLRIQTLERLFCERCLVNALLDAVNFNCSPAGDLPLVV